MSDKREDLRLALAESRMMLRCLQTANLTIKWGVELQFYAALLGKVNTRKAKTDESESN